MTAPTRLLYAGSRLALIALFLFAFLLRLAFGLWQGLGSPPPAGSDEHEYVTYALSLAEHGEYRGMSPDVADQNHLTAYRTPGTSVVYAGVIAAFGESYAALRVANCVFSSLACVVIVALGARVFTPRVAWLAGFGWAVYPRALFFSTSLLSESLGLLTFLLFLLLAIEFATSRKVSTAVWAGLVLGIAILVHPTRLFLAPLVLLWAGVHFWNDRTVLRLAFMMLVIGALTVSTWALRNYQVFGQFIPLSTSGGSALLQGNNRLVATEPSLMGYSVWDTELPEYREALRTAGDEVTRDGLAGRFALEWIRSNPRLLPALVVKKLQRGFTPLLQPNTAALYRWVELLCWGPILMLTLVGIYPITRAMIRTNNPGWLLQLSLLHVVFVAMIFFGNSRYRFPVEPIFLLFACTTLVGIADAVTGRRLPQYEEVVQSKLKTGLGHQFKT